MTVIQVENISKLYRLGEIGTGSLAHDVNLWWHKLRGKENPYAKIAETNNREKKGDSEYVWALQDVNFDVQKGEVLGIIGKNGAGKSTLLKILSRVTAPTGGCIKAKGRIASLLEVGTGFHPELTGRDNVFLNGTILGMTRREIHKKFDEIVAFSGVERYIDTPVKRYSSGMYVRLAFAVAAHLEPEILIVDEVLAVGDADFQKKSIGKMKDVSVNEGRTVLFVSHNMAAVKELCGKGVLMEGGRSVFYGTQNEAVDQYLKRNTIQHKIEHRGHIGDAIGNNHIRILNLTVLPSIGNAISISSGIEIDLTFYQSTNKSNLAVTSELRTTDDVIVYHHGTWICEENNSQPGIYNLKIKLNKNLLNAGTYKFNLIFAASVHQPLLVMNDLVQFEVMNESLAGAMQPFPGIIRPEIDYKQQFLGTSDNFEY